MSAARAMLAFALAAVAAGPAMAADAKAAPPAKADTEAVDAEFLEFLGSLDLEEETWREYLEAKPVQNAAGKPAAKAAPPRESEQAKAKDTKQVKKP